MWLFISKYGLLWELTNRGWDNALHSSQFFDCIDFLCKVIFYELPATIEQDIQQEKFSGTLPSSHSHSIITASCCNGEQKLSHPVPVYRKRAALLSVTFTIFHYPSCSFSLCACLFSQPHPSGSVFFLSTQLTREICKSKWRLCRVSVFLKLKEIFFSLSKNVQTEACSTVLNGKIYLNWLCICPTFFELQGRVDAGYIVGKKITATSNLKALAKATNRA